MKKSDAPKPTPALRRQPTQERALQTIETIFGATAQIVEQQGEAAVTTNRIAEVAGFSIGTLYQYFPSKEAILLAMVERERKRVQQQIQELLDAAVAERREVRAVLREMVGLLVAAFGTGRSLAGRQMVRLGWRIDHHDSITAAMREGAERNALALSRLVEEGGDASVRLPTPAMMFVATRAVMGAIRSAALENSPLLGSPAFEDELVRMVWGLLRADGEVPRAAR